MAGYPAGMVLDAQHSDDPNDRELRIAFDFDAVLIDDEAERVFAEGGLDSFHQSEQEKSEEPHTPGPLQLLLSQISTIQKSEKKKASTDPSYQPLVRIAIITSRNAPAHKRMVTTLRAWDIQVDETFFLGGVDKSGVLEEFNPHIFFDDQRIHLDAVSGIVPSVHVPFGIRNQTPTQDPEAI